MWHRKYKIGHLVGSGWSLSWIIIAFALPIFAGCARFPTGGVSPSGRELIITMRVAGRINPSYYYFIAFNTGPDTLHGPVPVTGQPWGNGWGTGTITFFVRYAQGGYRIFRIVPGTDNLGIVDAGSPPIRFDPPGTNGNTLRFTVDLAQIATAEIPADRIESITLNFIATDQVPEDPNFLGPKYYDALGETGSDFLTISTIANRVYSNSEFQLESAGDVLSGDADLDIVDWTIEVRGF